MASATHKSAPAPARVPARALTALFGLWVAACGTTPADPIEPPSPGGPSPIASPELCARADDDVSALFCGDGGRSITSLAELKAALRLDRTLFLAHSTALDGRLASPINPRAVSLRIERFQEGYAAATFTRGSQRAELISLDRRSGRFNLYVLDFKQACNDEPEGCSYGDRFTPAIERDWRELRLRDDEDLKNTPLDCRRCHGGSPQDGGKPSLLMREMDPPWMHWFPIGRSALHEVFQDAKQDEPYAGVEYPPDSPHLLEDQIRIAQLELAQPRQALNFLSGIIAIEMLELEQLLTGKPDDDVAGFAQSPTWQLLFDAYRQGLSPAPPYYHELIADPDKLRAASDAYRAYLDGRIAADELPDIGDVLPDDQQRLAEMGFAVEPGAPMDVLLVQACGQCHNSSLDQSLSRARFDIDLSRVAPEILQLASARLALPDDDPGAMPPPGSRTMSAEQRRALRDFLREIDPTKVPPRETLDSSASPYALVPSYDYERPSAPTGEVVIGDVSGDGRPDVISAPFVFEQQSDGSFKASLLPIPPLGSITLFDVNDDGLLDIVSRGAGNEATSRDQLGLSVFLSQSGLSFSDGITSPGPTPLDLVRASFSDVDADGHVDFVTRATKPNDRVVVYRGDGSGAFTVADVALAQPTGALLSALTLGDVTGDQREDLILFDRAAPASLIIHPHDGGSGFVAEGTRHEVHDSFATTLFLSIGDGNADGRNDIAISPGVRLMLQDERGNFGPAPLIESNDGPARFFDLNGDGLQDLVGLAQSQGAVRVMLQGTRGLMHPKSASFLLPGTPGSLLDTFDVGDLDGDGCADVAVARSGSIDVMRGEGCDL
jgi:mono/diheme cytochrome c family protein